MCWRLCTYIQQCAVDQNLRKLSSCGRSVSESPGFPTHPAFHRSIHRVHRHMGECRPSQPRNMRAAARASRVASFLRPGSCSVTWLLQSDSVVWPGKKKRSDLVCTEILIWTLERGFLCDSSIAVPKEADVRQVSFRRDLYRSLASSRRDSRGCESCIAARRDLYCIAVLRCIGG